ncbi:MAG: serine/threonine protein kinase [Bacteroidales bacterium]|nr:serine/threonine protein kinase [Bacteroidales bacterium]
MTDSTQQYDIGQIIDGQYRLIEPISTQGGSADVWLAIDINTVEDPDDESSATRVAVKIYRRKNIIDVEGLFQFRSEFKKLFGCHHQNIIPPTYFSVFDDNPYLVLPYCPSGSSELLIGQLSKAEDIWKYIYQVASGLAYLHERTPQIIHQDIKPANVLIDDNGNYAITDFGISAAIGRADMDDSDDSYGTYAYMGPERFRHDAQPMPESDIWAFGATLYELMAGDTPFGNEGGERQQRNTPIPPLSKAVPEDVRSLIYSCLAYDPAARPTARQIVDRVLKRRYARNRKVVLLSVAAAVAVTAALLLIFGGKGDNSQDRYDTLCQKADSILEVNLPPILANDNGAPIGDIAPLGEAIITLNDARSIPAEIPGKDILATRVRLLEQLQREIASYDSLGVMIDRARRAEIEEFLVEGPIKQAQHKEKINNLISQIQSSQ